MSAAKNATSIALGEVIRSEDLAQWIYGSGEWIEVNSPAHGAAALAVWRMDGDERSTDCEEFARRLVASLNACAGVPVEVLEAKASGGLPWMVADQIDALAERRALVAALQPFVARNSSDETITITVRTADVAQARAVIAKATGITPAAAAPAPTTSRCPHCGDWLGEHDRDCIKFGRGAA